MSGSMAVLATAASFVGTHFVLSHPLRVPLVRAVGEKAFLGLYSLVAFATLGAMVWAYRAAPASAALWAVGDWLWALASALMLIASILFLGSLIRNPALPGAEGQAGHAQARGVFAVTRHPMMWSFAIWGLCHILIYPVAKNLIVCGAIIVLALGGAVLQDRKKAALDPAGWPAWQARTSYLPFAAVAAGRAQLGGFGMHAIAGGLVVWLGATWAHLPLAGWPAGIWRWIA
ncbi:NnrU family protein [Novosphingobium sp. Leaf2]|uniref:NnrU family protein n=1 Tax=Novosphingobium sp. Leaf2 TaxID=1735670 RepID=UPI0006F72AEC|nr:NnrU family protein [Novosphingobium sp. Leaf2]KQM18939.1 MFS transporter [Novosphingobium sp. Leaf2]